MIDTSRPLIGGAARLLGQLRKLIKRHDRLAILLYGYPGVAKSDLLDRFALEQAGSDYAIERANGQSVTIEVVRQWRDRGAVGNLFSQWTVKRIDELDKASPAARYELLTYADYLPKHTLVLATTNDYGSIRGDGERRFESRFKVFEVEGPTLTEAIHYLVTHFKVSAEVAQSIALTSVPDGCLPTVGINMRLAIDNAQTYLDLREPEEARTAA
jgi:hypothetical protein